MTNKNLLRNNFDVLDGGLGLVVFVALQILFYFLLGFLPREVLANNAILTLLNVALEALFIISSYFVCFTRRVNMPSATGLNKKVNLKMVGLCALISVACLLFFSDLTNGFMMILENCNYKSAGGSEITTVGDYFLGIITICVIPAFCEETLFRGVVLGSLKNYNKWLAIAVSGITFMLMHGNPDQTIHQLILGLILAYICVETGNLWLTIIIHFFNNFFAITISFFANMASNGAVAETGAAKYSAGQIVGTILFGLAFAAVGIYAIIMVVKQLKKYSDKTQQEKQLIAPETNNGEQPQPAEPSSKTKPAISRGALLLTVACYTLFCIYFVREWILLLLSRIA